MLADIAAEYDYGWAAAYDLVVRRKGEQDLTFGSVEALPFYADLNADIMLGLKMKLSPPAHRASNASSARGPAPQPVSAGYADQHLDSNRKRRRRGGGKPGASDYEAERLKPFPSPPAVGYPAIMPPPSPKRRRQAQWGQGQRQS